MEKIDQTRLSGRACARALGISHTRLAALFREGRLPRNADRTFNLAAVRRAFEWSRDPAQYSKISGG